MLITLVVLLITVLALQSYPIALGISFKSNPSKSLGFIVLLTSMHALMLWLGFVLGSTFMHLMEGFKSVVMFMSIVLVGVRMLMEVLSIRKGERTFAITTVMQLILVSIALGINAFLIGLVFNYLNISIIKLVSLLAAITFIISIIGSLTSFRKVNIFLATLFSALGGVVMVFAAIYFTFFYF